MEEGEITPSDFSEGEKKPKPKVKKGRKKSHLATAPEPTPEKPKETPQEATVNNIEVKRLLRGPRYFTPQFEKFDKCFNCGETGHMAASCSSAPREKPCFVCSEFGHEGRNCPQKNCCFSCEKPGHIAKNCPETMASSSEKRNRRAPSDESCLKCGQKGHSFNHCDLDYDPADLKHLKCYGCGKKGHLCCFKFNLEPSEKLTCYNCGSEGHSGEDCNRSRWKISELEINQQTGQTCHRCGLVGHIKRDCNERQTASKWVQRYDDRKSWPPTDSDKYRGRSPRKHAQVGPTRDKNRRSGDGFQEFVSHGDTWGTAERNFDKGKFRRGRERSAGIEVGRNRADRDFVRSDKKRRWSGTGFEKDEKSHKRWR